MNTKKYVIARQMNWAHRHSIALKKSISGEGVAPYVKDLDDNLFVPLSNESLREISDGDGNEFRPANGQYAKMCALHSSSAIGVNFFEYWRQVDDASLIASLCKLCNPGNKKPKRIEFEGKFPITGIQSSIPPNIDVVIHTEDFAIKAYGIECKFTEVSGGHTGLKQAYLGQCGSLWDDIPGLLHLSKSISPDDILFKYLHAAQLIKHILGMKSAYGLRGFRLLYLYYDGLGNEGSAHRQEILKFARIAKSDGIMFHHLSYQELITNMASKLDIDHKEYTDYLVERYL